MIVLSLNNLLSISLGKTKYEHLSPVKDAFLEKDLSSIAHLFAPFIS